MKKLQFILISLLLATVVMANTQQVQTVRGTVLDADSKTPLPGANVVLLSGADFKGTISDMDGSFVIANIPVGRIDLKISFLGYEERIVSNILLTSAKEVVLEIELTESVTSLDEVEVVATRKGEVLNEMSLVSARAFSVEETKRFAGSFSDPARMVASYAGVAANAEGSNEIVVRGNSSDGIQWRLEGFEIPNPNHFADEGATGGPINALNSDMLANSDFLTGAFAPEYGNAYSGVFDMKLRTGNNRKREYAMGISALGLDATAEGPFSKNSNASYLVNYRYSSLALLSDLGVVDFGGIPKYQDASFKVKLPTKTAGTFTLFGLGGKSNIHEEYTADDEITVTDKGDYKAEMGVVGLSHLYLFNEQTYLKTGLLASENGNGYQGQTLDGATGNFYDDSDYFTRKYAWSVKTELNHKINARNRIQAGATFTQQNFEVFLEYFDEDKGLRVKDFDSKSQPTMMQYYANWKHRLGENITFIGGLHYMNFSLGNASSLEPRLSMQWDLGSRSTLNAGFGVHSRTYSLMNYFKMADSPSDPTVRLQANTNLGLPKANHYVLGYDYRINKNMHVKTELYYQHLYDIAIEDVPGSTFSLINVDDDFADNGLINTGTGRNYGVELTLERFYANNYFFLLTGSLYQSKYTAADGKERDTRYNGNYVANALFGKEFLFGADRQHAFTLSTKFFVIGGRRHTGLTTYTDEQGAPFIDLDYPNRYAQKGRDVYQLNLALGVRLNYESISHEIKIDVQNVTNSVTPINPYFNEDKGILEYSEQLSLLPNIVYRIYF